MTSSTWKYRGKTHELKRTPSYDVVLRNLGEPILLPMIGIEWKGEVIYLNQKRLVSQVLKKTKMCDFKSANRAMNTNPSISDGQLLNENDA